MRTLKNLQKKYDLEKGNYAKKDKRSITKLSTRKEKFIDLNPTKHNTSTQAQNEEKISTNNSKEKLAEYVKIKDNLGDILNNFYKHESQQNYPKSKPKIPVNNINNQEIKESPSFSKEKSLLSKKRERSYNSQYNWEEFSFGKKKKMKYEEKDNDSNPNINSYPKEININIDNIMDSNEHNNKNESSFIANSFNGNSKKHSSLINNMEEDINYSTDLAKIIQDNRDMLHDCIFLKFNNLQLTSKESKEKLYYSLGKLIDFSIIKHHLITCGDNATYAFFSLYKAIPLDNNIEFILKFEGIIPHLLEKKDFRFIAYLSPYINTYYTDMNYYTMMDEIYGIEEHDSLYKEYVLHKPYTVRRYISIGTNKINDVLKTVNSVYDNNTYYKRLDNIWHEYAGQKVVIVDFISELKKGIFVNMKLFLDKLSEGKMFPATKTEETKDVFWPDYDILILICSLDFEELSEKYYQPLYKIIYDRFESILINDEQQLSWLYNKLKDRNYS